MIAKAKHPVNYAGAWYTAGEAFEIDAADAEMMAQYAEIIRPAEADSPAEYRSGGAGERPEPEQPRRRGRNRRDGEGKDEE